MTAPSSKLQALPNSSSDSQVIARSVAVDAGLVPPDERAQRAQSKLPTFVRGRVLARRFFVDEVFEFTPQSTFLRAHDLELERVVLVRLLPRPDPDASREHASGWFRRLDQPLSSPGILGTLGVGVLQGGWPMLVCQYWRGRSLEAFLRSGEAPNLLLILQIARQVALALAEAHRLGHAHGELRSDDVWLSRQVDGGERAMILGFQPHGSTETGLALVARDLNAFGDLLSLMVASLLPRYRSAKHKAAFDEHAHDSGPLIVLVGPLARVAARCQGPSAGRPYLNATEVAGALEQVESIATHLSAH
jgi:hypothetical protein